MPFLGADFAAQAFYADTITPVIQQLLLKGFSLLSKRATSVNEIELLLLHEFLECPSQLLRNQILE